MNNNTIDVINFENLLKSKAFTPVLEGKKPFIQNWINNPLSVSDISSSAKYINRSGIGFIINNQRDNIFCLDIDANSQAEREEALKILGMTENELQDTLTITSPKEFRSKHLFFIESKKEFSKSQYQFKKGKEDKKAIFEIFFKNKQVVIEGDYIDDLTKEKIGTYQSNNKDIKPLDLGKLESILKKLENRFIPEKIEKKEVSKNLNLEEFIQYCRTEIESDTGYYPQEIIFNNEFQRFGKNKRGAYIAVLYIDCKGRERAYVSFTDWSDKYKTLYSWTENDLKDYSESEKEAFKIEWEKRKEELKAKKEAKEAESREKALKLYTQFKDNKITESNYKNTYLNDKNFSLDDLKADPCLFMGDDFIGYPLYLNNEVVGIKKLYKDSKYTYGLAGFHVLGIEKNKETEEINDISTKQKINNLQSSIQEKKIQIEDNRKELNILKKADRKEEKRKVVKELETELNTLLAELEELTPKKSLNERVIYIAEGYATGLSVHLATEKPVFIADSCNRLKACTQEARRAFPKAIIVECADKDFESKTGEKAALNACEGVTGCLVKLPYLENREKERELKSLDFDDLRRLEGLDKIQKILDPEKIKNKFIHSIQEYKNCYVKFPSLDFDKPVYLSNFIFDLKHELKEQAGTIRHIQLIGKKEVSKIVSFENDIFTNTAELRKFVYKQGKYTIEDSLDPEELRKFLIEKKSLFVFFLEKVGRHDNKFYFGNCALTIGEKELVKPDENGFFDNGFDERGNKKALLLNVEGKLPILNLDLEIEESKQILETVLKTLKEAYGFNAVCALACVFSGLFREEIAKYTGTGQYPALYLNGDPKGGKSNLVKILESFQGFKDSGDYARSTEPVLRGLISDRKGLLTPIYEIKPPDMGKIENIQQLAYDGGIKGKKTRAGNDWVTLKSKPESFLIFDSNHLPSMESLLERIILLEFKKTNFKVNKAKLLNIYSRELSGITRHFLQWVNLEKLKTLIESINSNYSQSIESREALIASYIRIGLVLLCKFLDSEFGQELAGKGKEAIDIYIEESRREKQELKIADRFLDYFFNAFLASQKEASPLISQESNSLFIACSLINQALEKFETEKKGLGLPNIKDTKDSIKRASFCKNHNKQKRFPLLTDIPPKCYEFDLLDSSIPKSIRERFEITESDIPF